MNATGFDGSAGEVQASKLARRIEMDSVVEPML
jgi:hypothetical protein